MKRPLLLGLCGMVLATGLSAVIAVAGNPGDARSADVVPPGFPCAITPPAAADTADGPVVREKRKRPFVIKVSPRTTAQPAGNHPLAIEAVPLDGPMLPDSPDAAAHAAVPELTPAVTSLPDPAAPVALPPAPTVLPDPVPPAMLPAPSASVQPQPEAPSAVVPVKTPILEQPPASLGFPALDKVIDAPLEPVPGNLPAPAASTARPYSNSPADPRALLRNARQLQARNKLAEAEALARHIAAMPVKWNTVDDSPEKLLADIQNSRRTTQTQSDSTPRPRLFGEIRGRLAERFGGAGPVTGPVLQVPPEAIGAPAIVPPAAPIVQTSAVARDPLLAPGAAAEPVPALRTETHETPAPLVAPVEAVPVPSTFATQPALAPSVVAAPAPIPVPPPPAVAAPAFVPSSPAPAATAPVLQSSPAPGPLAIVDSPVPVAPAKDGVAPVPVPCPAPVCDAMGHENDRRLYVAGHVGFAIVRPYFKNNPAFFVSTAGNPAFARQIEFGYAGQFVPEISLAVVGPGDWGFRTNWWGFATSDTQVVTGSPRTVSASPLRLGFISTNTGDRFTASAQLAMNVWDIEATRDFRGSSWAILVGGGFRYAHIAQRYDAVQVNGGTNTLLSGHSFNGIGPTLFARGRWQLCRTGFYVFGAGRGSLLGGREVQDAAAALVGPPRGVDASTTSRLVMPVAELEFGMGWRRLFDGIDAFIEMGLDHQVWFEAGNASRSTIQSNQPIVTTGSVSSSTVDYNLGLLAFTMRVGINY